MSDANEHPTHPLCPLCTRIGPDGEQPTPGMLRIAIGDAHRSVECWLCHGEATLHPDVYNDWINDGHPRSPKP